MPEALDTFQEIGNRVKADGALAELAMIDDRGPQFVCRALPEADGFASQYFAARTDQALPGRRVDIELFCQQHFDTAMEEAAHSRVAGAERLGPKPAAVSEEAGGYDACVVQDEQIARLQMLGKFPEPAILKVPGFPVQVEHAGGSAVSKRLLCYEFFREMEIEVRDEHETL